jgi:hypothetical protein
MIIYDKLVERAIAAGRCILVQGLKKNGKFAKNSVIMVPMVTCPLNLSRPAGHIYIPLTKSLFKSTGETVSLFFSMLLSTSKYLYSVEPVRINFPAKQPSSNGTVFNDA